MCACVLEGRDNLKEFDFLLSESQDGSQVVGRSDKCLYSLSLLISPSSGGRDRTVD